MLTLLAAGAAASTPERALQPAGASTAPLRWVHIPKCGQSFALTFYAYACPACAKDITDQLLAYGETSAKGFSGDDGQAGEVSHIIEDAQLRGCCDPSRLLEGAQSPIGHVPAGYRDLGHIVVMLRDPVQRLMSHYHYFGEREHPNMTEWLAEPKHYGCQASMLLPAALNIARPGQVGLSCGRAGAAAPLSPEQVAAVVALVRDPSRVPFVGILEAWNASVALFHAAFDGGSAVAPEELENIHVSRPSSGGSAGAYEVPEGLADPADQAVYDAALERFLTDAATHAEALRRRGPRRA